MKKNYTLFLLTVLFAWVGNAQTPCSQDNPAPVTNIIYTNPENTIGNPSVAFDLTVDAYTQFDLTTVTVKMATANMAALNPTGIVSVYTSSGDVPATELASETITPTVVTEAPISTFAIYTVTFTFSTPVELDNMAGATDATFWVGFVMGNVDGGNTGVTGGSLIAGLPYASINDTSGGWVLSTGGLDGTYTFEGTCLLGVDEFSLENSVSIFPNPTSNIITIDTSNKITVNSLELYNIVGKQVIKSNNVNSLDLSELSSGVYMLRVLTDSGTLTKKVIRN